jgi:ribonuclease P protein component
VSSRFMTLVARPNALARDRLGVVASRRVGGAVLRNRAKRRLRELFRRRAEPDMSQAARSGYDIVAIARPELATAPFGQVRSDFDAALRRLRRLVR